MENEFKYHKIYGDVKIDREFGNETWVWILKKVPTDQLYVSRKEAMEEWKKDTIEKSLKTSIEKLK